MSSYSDDKMLLARINGGLESFSVWTKPESIVQKLRSPAAAANFLRPSQLLSLLTCVPIASDICKSVETGCIDSEVDEGSTLGIYLIKPRHGLLLARYTVWPTYLSACNIPWTSSSFRCVPPLSKHMLSTKRCSATRDECDIYQHAEYLCMSSSLRCVLPLSEQMLSTAANPACACSHRNVCCDRCLDLS